MLLAKNDFIGSAQRLDHTLKESEVVIDAFLKDGCDIRHLAVTVMAGMRWRHGQ